MFKGIGGGHCLKQGENNSKAEESRTNVQIKFRRAID